MTWSFPIGSIRGTEIRLHVTFLLFLLWIGGAHWAAGGAAEAATGVLFVLILFACVVLHEFGHVAAASRYGVRTPDITLLPIGGVARLERIPEEPAQELVVALAGPAVNVAIAALLYLLLGGLPDPMQAVPQDPRADLLGRVLWANVFLVVFNLIPAFPMDGGRVLRALLAMRMGHVRATQIAASVGQAVAVGLGLIGLFGNPLLLFIALFVWLGAAGEAHAAQLRDLSRGLRVGDATVTRFESLGVGATVEDAVQCLIRTTQHDFPVVDGAGRLRGVLTRDDIIRALREQGPEAPALEVMRADIPVLHHRASLEEALRLLQAGGHPAVGAVDSAGRLLGLVTTENIGEMMMVHAARPGLRLAPPHA